MKNETKIKITELKIEICRELEKNPSLSPESRESASIKKQNLIKKLNKLKK
jgi:hypothetical protein